jgi:hypothetical protein
MKTKTQLQKDSNLYSKFAVIVREDNFDNAGDAEFKESEYFNGFEDAYIAYVNEVAKIKNLATNSEYKGVEFCAILDDDFGFEEIDSEIYIVVYEPTDFGKILLCRIQNRGFVSAEIIDKNTKYFGNDDRRFAPKSYVFDTQKEAIQYIYDTLLYISLEDAEDILNGLLT